MGGSAPDPGKTKSAYPDYLEILEFGHGSLKRKFPDLAVLYPTRDALAEGIRAQYGDATLRGMTGFRIPRSKIALRVRARAFRVMGGPPCQCASLHCAYARGLSGRARNKGGNAA
jgi:hypothetical protein